jgi:hypothetical protein
MGKLSQALRNVRSNVNLFRSIKKCRVSFDPYDQASTSAREFLRRLNSPRVRKANPRLEVQTLVSDEGGSGGARLSIDFSDGKKLDLDPTGMTVKEIEHLIALEVPMLTIYKSLEEEATAASGSR